MIRKLCNSIFSLILIVVTAVSLALFVPTLLGYKTFAVISGSMEPNVHVGSLAYVKPMEASEIKVGDIITFHMSGQQGMMATHRVVEIQTDKNAFITKGDANENVDGALAFERLLGKMTYSIPYLGYVTVYLKTMQGLVLAGAILILMVLLTIIPDFLNKGRAEKLIIPPINK